MSLEEVNSWLGVVLIVSSAGRDAAGGLAGRTAVPRRCRGPLLGVGPGDAGVGPVHPGGACEPQARRGSSAHRRGG